MVTRSAPSVFSCLGAIASGSSGTSGCLVPKEDNVGLEYFLGLGIGKLLGPLVKLLTDLIFRRWSRDVTRNYLINCIIQIEETKNNGFKLLQQQVQRT